MSADPWALGEIDRLIHEPARLVIVTILNAVESADFLYLQREAGLTKMEIRELSRELGLATWNKPANACLASRIPYGQPITVEKLEQVACAETYIRELVSSWQVRLRHEGDTARIEVEPEAMTRFLETDVRHQITDHLKALGFKFVALDLDGYRTGSLNCLLEPQTNSRRLTREKGVVNG